MPNQAPAAPAAAGVFGQSNSAAGVVGRSNTGTALVGLSTNGTAIRGDTAGDGQVAVEGVGDGNHGVGVRGLGHGVGVKGHSFSYFGVAGDSTQRIGVYGESAGNVVHGKYDTGAIMPSSGPPLLTYGPAGVSGVATGTEGVGVQGQSDSGPGLDGRSVSGAGIYAYSYQGYAGIFGGNVFVQGTLYKGGGGFRIDHPLDPANKYLTHSFVESPDMKNIYDGVATLDKKGEAIVELPKWFKILNKDFRYQLTPIGSPGPGLYIAQEIAGTRFKISGGKPKMQVSWQVTAIRQDVWAKTNRLVVEENKSRSERGYYLHPELYGRPEKKRITNGEPVKPLVRVKRDLARLKKKKPPRPDFPNLALRTRGGKQKSS